MKKIILKKNEERRIKHGHLWIFSNEIGSIEGDPENGDVVSLYSNRNEFIGDGFYNKNSLIAFRLLSKEKIDDLRQVLRARLLSAGQLRHELYPERNSYRLVFSESDFIPGLIIDKYNDTFVLQIYSWGIQKNISFITEILREDFGAVNIFSRNEEHFRKLEGLSTEDEVYSGEMKAEQINDGTISYQIDFQAGQKTGFYFDQCDNRVFIERLTAGKTVVDCFCNSGGFGLHASAAGAKKVIFVDSSAREIETVKKNYSLNKFENETEYHVTDVFDYLESSVKSEEQYDIVMIDPPAFAKNRKSLPAAIKGYEKLNRLALKLVKDGGYLVTSSCSHHLNENELFTLLSTAAAKNNCHLQLIHFNNASLDHPENPSMPETVYLKFAVLKKLQ